MRPMWWWAMSGWTDWGFGQCWVGMAADKHKVDCFAYLKPYCLSVKIHLYNSGLSMSDHGLINSILYRCHFDSWSIFLPLWHLDHFNLKALEVLLISLNLENLSKSSESNSKVKSNVRSNADGVNCSCYMARSLPSFGQDGSSTMKTKRRKKKKVRNIVNQSV